MNEARIRSRYIRMHAFFSCLHCYRTDPICVTYKQKIGIGSHLTDSVNGAKMFDQVLGITNFPSSLVITKLQMHV